MSKQNIITIGDLHAPGQLDGYLDFVSDTAKMYSCETSVCTGDLIDFHYISRHLTEPEALSPIDELDAAKAELKRWVKVFPNMKVCLGNHDEIPYRQAESLGIPRSFMKSLNDLLGLPKTWKFRPFWKLNDIIFEHGLGSNGMYGAKNTAKEYMTSYVQGHTHSNAGVWWIETPFKRVFGMQVGCGIDENKYNAKYGKKYFKKKTAPGCGVILDGGKIAFHVPMDLKKYGAYQRLNDRL